MIRPALAAVAALVLTLLAIAVPTTASASSIATSVGDTCALGNDQQVRCWGDDRVVPGGPVPGLTNAVDIAVGADHRCGVRATGTVGCWGRNLDGQLGDGTIFNATTAGTVTGLNDAIAVAAGGRHSCALRANGRVTCWGSVPPASVTDAVTDAVGIDAEGYDTCVVRASGAVSCWWIGSPLETVPGLTDATQVAVGISHGCAVRRTGGVTCWGENDRGQLGQGHASAQSGPVAVPGLTNVVRIAAGQKHTCATRTDATVVCWGANESGQLGDGTFADRTAPVTATGVSGAAAITASANHTCVSRGDGTAGCWGANDGGQLGNGKSTTSSSPVTVPNVSNAIAVSGTDEAHHRCAVITGGTVRCWGRNAYGELGGGAAPMIEPTPVAVPGVSGVAGISVALDFTCVLGTSGAVRCWGRNTRGQLGNGTTSHSTAPVTVQGLNASQISTSYNHGCAVTSGGTPEVRCWGDQWQAEADPNYSGWRIRSTPVTIPGTSGATAVVSTQFADCALISGTVKCWGANHEGDLGIGPGFPEQETPVNVPGITTATKLVSVSQRSYCAELAGGEVRCWGSDFGPTPQVVSGADPTPAGTCRVSSGSVICAGSGASGQLGDGYQPTGHLPKQRTIGTVVGLTGVRPLPIRETFVPTDIEVTPATLTFADALPGTFAPTLSVTVRNTHATLVPIGFSATAPAPTGDFTQSATTCGTSLGPNESCTVSYVFQPTQNGARSATATLVAAGLPRTIELRGHGGVSTPGGNPPGGGDTPGGGDDPGGGDTLGGGNPPGPGPSDPPPFVPAHVAPTPVPAPPGGGGVPGTPTVKAFAFTSAQATTKRRTRLTVAIPSAGRLAITATTRVKGTTVSWYRTGKARSIKKAGTTRLTISPTAKARKALKGVKRAKVRIALRFTPNGGKVVTRTRTVTVRL